MKEQKNNKYNLVEGSIINKLFVIALPIMGTQFLQMTYSLTDMFWLGRLSSDAVAAAGTAGMYVWMSAAFLMIGRMGAEIGVSQYIGRQDRETAQRFSENAVLLAIVLGVLFGGSVMAFRYPLIGFFGIQEQEVVQAAADYLMIIGIGVPATFISGTIGGIFTGAGNSKLPFYINGIGLVVNMILDPLLIFGMDMGIQGAAAATIIGQILVMLLFLAAVKRNNGRPFEQYSFRNVLHPHRAKIKQICRWSIPVGLESLCFTCLSMIISRMVASYGADAIAAQKVGSQVESLSWLICGGFSSALTAFIGQNYGAGKWDRVKKGFRFSMLLMGAWGLIVTVLLITGDRFLVKIFVSEPEIIQLGAGYLRILGLAQLASSAEAVAAGVFRGIGKTTSPSIVSIFSNLIRIPIAYMLAQTTLGIEGIWWGIAAGNFMRGIFLIIWYIPVERKIGKR